MPTYGFDTKVNLLPVGMLLEIFAYLYIRP